MIDNFKINSFHLKLIAIITMTIDHIGAILFPQYLILRIIGRVAFILFAFMTAQAMVYSNNKIRYLRDLLIGSIIIGIFFLVAGVSLQTNTANNSNIFLTLFLGAGAIYIYQQSTTNAKKLLKFVNYISVILIIITMVLFLENLGQFPMYGLYGVLIIYHFYFISLIKSEFFQKCGYIIFLLLINLLFYSVDSVQFYSIFALLPILFYSGERGYYNIYIKYLFYIYYPLHLAVITLLSFVI